MNNGGLQLSVQATTYLMNIEDRTSRTKRPKHPTILRRSVVCRKTSRLVVIGGVDEELIKL